MKKSNPSLLSTQQSTGTEGESLHRSGAVAHMLRMPVATLRVWNAATD